MRFFRLSTALASLFLALTVAAPQLPAQQPAADPLHAWVQGSDPAALETWINLRLADAQADVDKVLAVTGPRTVENTLRPFDDAQNQLSIAGNNAALL